MYARMCVEVDLSLPLLPSYTVDGNSLKIEYEGLQLICFHCGKFGHDSDHCSLKRAQEAETNQNKASEPQNNAGAQGQTRHRTSSPEQVFGEWMVAQDPRKIRRQAKKDVRVGEGQKKTVGNDYDIGAASRFAILEDEIEKVAEEDSRNPKKDNLNDLRKRDEDKKFLSKSKKHVIGSEIDLKRREAKEKELTKGGKPKETKPKDKVGANQEVNKENVDQGRSLKGTIMDKTSRQEMGQNEVVSNGPEEMHVEEQGKKVEKSHMGLLSKQNVGPHEMRHEGLDENSMDSSLESLPDQVQETMDIEENKPPDPNFQLELLGLSNVEELKRQQTQNEDCQMISPGDDVVSSERM